MFKAADVDECDGKSDTSSESSGYDDDGDVAICMNAEHRDDPKLFVGEVTGVELIRTIDMRLSCFIGKEREGEKANSKNGNVRTDHVDGARLNRSKGIHGVPRLYPGDSDSDESESEDRNVVKGDGGTWFCRTCEESSGTAKEAQHHSGRCKIPAESCLFADQAVRMAKELIESNGIVVHTKADNNPTFNSIHVSDDVRATTKFKPYWALRPTQGASMGTWERTSLGITGTTFIVWSMLAIIRKVRNKVRRKYSRSFVRDIL